MRFAVVSILFCTFCASIFVEAAPQNYSVLSGQVQFLAIGKPAMMRIRGSAEKGLSGTAQVKDKQVTGQFQFKVDELKTGIDLRDRHMKEKYLQTEKFPQAQMEIKKMEMPADSELQNAKKVSFEGELQIHGVKKTITGNTTLQKKGKNISAQVEFPTKIADHMIDLPSYAGIKVADEIQITVDLELAPQ